VDSFEGALWSFHHFARIDRTLGLQACALRCGHELEASALLLQMTARTLLQMYLVVGLDLLLSALTFGAQTISLGVHFAMFGDSQSVFVGPLRLYRALTPCSLGHLVSLVGAAL